MTPDSPFAKWLRAHGHGTQTSDTSCTQRSSSCGRGGRAVKSVPVYKGVWSADCYALNDMVTHGGALWIALLDTSAKPGDAYTGWQL
jgi:hypothetical protein